MSHNNSEQNANDWPVSAQIPQTAAGVYLLFHGLFGFTHNHNNGSCEVGVHCKAPDHVFKILVFETTPTDRPRLIYAFEPDSPFEVPGGLIEVHVDLPVIEGVSYFQPAHAQTMDNRDWRRLPDFESPLFYDQPLSRKGNGYRPLVTINNALFSVIPTDLEFVRFVSDQSEAEMNIGPIAMYVLGAINHQDHGGVILRIGATALPLIASSNRHYVVVFANSCPPSECRHDPNSTIKEYRNDFYLYYKTFEIPGGRKEYELKLAPGQNVDSVIKLDSFIEDFNFDLLESIQSSKDSPCGASGYGKSSGTLGL